MSRPQLALLGPEPEDGAAEAGEAAARGGAGEEAVGGGGGDAGEVDLSDEENALRAAIGRKEAKAKHGAKAKRGAKALAVATSGAKGTGGAKRGAKGTTNRGWDKRRLSMATEVSLAAAAEKPAIAKRPAAAPLKRPAASLAAPARVAPMSTSQRGAARHPAVPRGSAASPPATVVYRGARIYTSFRVRAYRCILDPQKNRSDTTFGWKKHDGQSGAWAACLAWVDRERR